MRFVALLAGLDAAAAHGMIISPKSRNANDAAHLGAGACNTYIDYNPPYKNTSVGFRETGSGQPCLWFSQVRSLPPPPERTAPPRRPPPRPTSRSRVAHPDFGSLAGRSR